MFDGGNYVGTDLEMDFDYSNDEISSFNFGPDGRYFTKKYDGLFVLAAINSGANSFYVWSNYGIDGEG